MKVLVATSTIILVSFSLSPATTIRVDWEGGGHYLTIQEGVTAASEGDTVLVAPGTYTGDDNRDIDFGGTNIVLVSEAGAENTIINCENLGQGLDINEGEDSTSVVQGFTIANASGGNGGGMNIHHAAATIRDCIFHGCSASNGAGMYIAYNETPVYISNCTFYANISGFRGGGIFVGNTEAEVYITDCTFYDNHVTSASHQSEGGGAITCTNGDGVITNCTVVGNSANHNAGGVWSYGSGMSMANTIIALSTQGAGYGSGGGGPPNISHCVVFGNVGGDTLASHPDNIYLDPLLCNVDQNNFALCANSPCLPGNNIWGELVGAYGQGCGDCDAPVLSTVWGQLKSLFR
jgi:hypothetical protein